MSTSKHSVIISIDSLDNKLRVASTNKNAIYNIIEWYEELTNENATKDKTAKYTNAFILKSALEKRIFGTDWIGIMVDFMFSIGYELIGNGNYVFESKKSNQIKNIMFISTKTKKKHLKSNYTPKIKYESIKDKEITSDKTDTQNKIKPNDKSICKSDEKYKILKTETFSDTKSENENENENDSKNNDESILIQSESSPAVYGNSQLLVNVIADANIKEVKEEKEQIIVHEIKNEIKDEKETFDEIKDENNGKKDTEKEKELIVKITIKKKEKELSVKTPKKKKKKKNANNFRDDPKNKFKRKKSRNKHGRNRAQSEGNVSLRQIDIEENVYEKVEEKEEETESILLIKKMSVDEMCAVILYWLDKKNLCDDTDVRLITNLVKVNLKLNGAKFIRMSRKEFESKFTWLKPTQAGRLYEQLRKHLSKQEIMRILKKSMGRSKSSSKRKNKHSKQKRERTRVQLTVDSDDGNNGSEDSDGF